MNNLPTPKLDSFEKSYREIVKSPLVGQQQWTRPGDMFVKFSLYEEYTPVETSNSTTIKSEE